MEGSVSNVEVCNYAYTGQFDKLKQCILSDKTLACKTDQVNFFMILFIICTLYLIGAFGKNKQMCFQDRRTALHWACSAGHTNIVEFLLDLGVEVNLQDDVGGFEMFIFQEVFK